MKVFMYFPCGYRNPSLGSLLTPVLSHVRYQTTGDAKYDVNGDILTREEILAVNPADRTIAHWIVLVDWNLQRQKPFVIIDPFDPSGLLYMNSTEYLAQTRTFASSNIAFVVVARPGSNRANPITVSPSTSPPPELDGTSALMTRTINGKRWWKAWLKRHRTFYEGRRRFSKEGSTWREFIMLRKWIIRNITWGSGGMVRVNEGNLGSLLGMWGRELSHYLDYTSPIRHALNISVIARHFQTLLKCNGVKFLSKRMKIHMYIIYTFVGGSPITPVQMEEFGHRIRLTNGLPAVYPKAVRDSLRQLNLKTVRLYCSLLNSYRYFEHPKEDTPMQTITSPAYTGGTGDFSSFMSASNGFWSRIREVAGEIPAFRYKSAHGRKMVSAGANAPIALMSLYWDLLAWKYSGKTILQEWFKLWNDRRMSQFMVQLTREAEDMIELSKCPRDGNNLPLSPRGSAPVLSRIFSFPALGGKIRAVAILDYFSQLALRPVHDYIFDILRKIPQDATFDQQSAVDDFKSRGYKYIASYDLSAATDMIPAVLYREVLELLLGRKGADLWLRILTDRVFEPPKEYLLSDQYILPSVYGAARGVRGVRYTRGQPMGGYSSWAGLAIVHHALVQFSAYRIGVRGWFKDYLVLGDDVQIASKDVGDEYLRVCQEFGIPVGVHKSLVSEQGLGNFASQTVLVNDNISPIPLGEGLVSTNWSRRLEMAVKTAHRYYDTTVFNEESRILRLLCTAPMWLSLQGELQGMAAPIKLNILRFFLRNPFTQKVHRVGIDSIVEWLALVMPNLSYLSAERRYELDKLIRYQLSDWLLERLKKYFDELQVDRIDSLISSVSPIPIKGGPKGAWVSAGPNYTHYMHECINGTMSHYCQKIMKLVQAIERWKEADTAPPISTLVDLWRDYSAIPIGMSFLDESKDFILWESLADHSEESSTTLSPDGKFWMAPKDSKDAIKAPLGILLKCVAEVVGEFSPAYSIAFGNLSGSHRFSLAKAVRDFEQAQAVSVASPNVWGVPLVTYESPNTSVICLGPVPNESSPIIQLPASASELPDRLEHNAEDLNGEATRRAKETWEPLLAALQRGLRD